MERKGVSVKEEDGWIIVKVLFFNFIEVGLIYNVVLIFLYSKVTELYDSIYEYYFSYFPYGLHMIWNTVLHAIQ